MKLILIFLLLCAISATPALPPPSSPTTLEDVEDDKLSNFAPLTNAQISRKEKILVKRFIPFLTDPNGLDLSFSSVLGKFTTAIDYMGFDTSGLKLLQKLYNSAFARKHLLFKRKVLNLIMQTCNFILKYLPEEPVERNPQLYQLNGLDDDEDDNLEIEHRLKSKQIMDRLNGLDDDEDDNLENQNANEHRQQLRSKQIINRLLKFGQFEEFDPSEGEDSIKKTLVPENVPERIANLIDFATQKPLVTTTEANTTPDLITDSSVYYLKVTKGIKEDDDEDIIKNRIVKRWLENRLRQKEEIESRNQYKYGDDEERNDLFPDQNLQTNILDDDDDDDYFLYRAAKEDYYYPRRRRNAEILREENVYSNINQRENVNDNEEVNPNLSNSETKVIRRRDINEAKTNRLQEQEIKNDMKIRNGPNAEIRLNNQNPKNDTEDTIRNNEQVNQKMKSHVMKIPKMINKNLPSTNNNSMYETSNEESKSQSNGSNSAVKMNLFVLNKFSEEYESDEENDDFESEEKKSVIFEDKTKQERANIYDHVGFESEENDDNDHQKVVKSKTEEGNNVIPEDNQGIMDVNNKSYLHPEETSVVSNGTNLLQSGNETESKHLNTLEDSKQDKKIDSHIMKIPKKVKVDEKTKKLETMKFETKYEISNEENKAGSIEKANNDSGSKVEMNFFTLGESSEEYDSNEEIDDFEGEESSLEDNEIKDEKVSISDVGKSKATEDSSNYESNTTDTPKSGNETTSKIQDLNNGTKNETTSKLIESHIMKIPRKVKVDEKTKNLETIKLETKYETSSEKNKSGSNKKNNGGSGSKVEMNFFTLGESSEEYDSNEEADELEGEESRNEILEDGGNKEEKVNVSETTNGSSNIESNTATTDTPKSGIETKSSIEVRDKIDTFLEDNQDKEEKISIRDNRTNGRSESKEDSSNLESNTTTTDTPKSGNERNEDHEKVTNSHIMKIPKRVKTEEKAKILVTTSKMTSEERTEKYEENKNASGSKVEMNFFSLDESSEDYDSNEYQEIDKSEAEERRNVTFEDSKNKEETLGRYEVDNLGPEMNTMTDIKTMNSNEEDEDNSSERDSTETTDDVSNLKNNHDENISSVSTEKNFGKKKCRITKRAANDFDSVTTKPQGDEILNEERTNLHAAGNGKEENEIINATMLDDDARRQKKLMKRKQFNLEELVRSPTMTPKTFSFDVTSNVLQVKDTTATTGTSAGKVIITKKKTVIMGRNKTESIVDRFGDYEKFGKSKNTMEEQGDKIITFKNVDKFFSEIGQKILYKYNKTKIKEETGHLQNETKILEVDSKPTSVDEEISNKILSDRFGGESNGEINSTHGNHTETSKNSIEEKENIITFKDVDKFFSQIGQKILYKHNKTKTGEQLSQQFLEDRNRSKDKSKNSTLSDKSKVEDQTENSKLIDLHEKNGSTNTEILQSSKVEEVQESKARKSSDVESAKNKIATSTSIKEESPDGAQSETVVHSESTTNTNLNSEETFTSSMITETVTSESETTTSTLNEEAKITTVASREETLTTTHKPSFDLEIEEDKRATVVRVESNEETTTDEIKIGDDLVIAEVPKDREGAEAHFEDLHKNLEELKTKSKAGMTEFVAEVSEDSQYSKNLKKNSESIKSNDEAENIVEVPEDAKGAEAHFKDLHKNMEKMKAENKAGMTEFSTEDFKGFQKDSETLKDEEEEENIVEVSEDLKGAEAHFEDLRKNLEKLKAENEAGTTEFITEDLQKDSENLKSEEEVENIVEVPEDPKGAEEHFENLHKNLESIQEEKDVREQKMEKSSIEKIQGTTKEDKLGTTLLGDLEKNLNKENRNLTKVAKVESMDKGEVSENEENIAKEKDVRNHQYEFNSEEEMKKLGDEEDLHQPNADKFDKKNEENHNEIIPPNPTKLNDTPSEESEEEESEFAKLHNMFETLQNTMNEEDSLKNIDDLNSQVSEFIATADKVMSMKYADQDTKVVKKVMVGDSQAEYETLFEDIFSKGKNSIENMQTTRSKIEENSIKKKDTERDQKSLEEKSEEDQEEEKQESKEEQELNNSQNSQEESNKIMSKVLEKLKNKQNHLQDSQEEISDENDSNEIFLEELHTEDGNRIVLAYNEDTNGDGNGPQNSSEDDMKNIMEIYGQISEQLITRVEEKPNEENPRNKTGESSQDIEENSRNEIDDDILVDISDELAERLRKWNDTNMEIAQKISALLKSAQNECIEDGKKDSVDSDLKQMQEGDASNLNQELVDGEENTSSTTEESTINLIKESTAEEESTGSTIRETMLNIFEETDVYTSEESTVSAVKIIEEATLSNIEGNTPNILEETSTNSNQNISLYKFLPDSEDNADNLSTTASKSTANMNEDTIEDFTLSNIEGNTPNTLEETSSNSNQNVPFYKFLSDTEDNADNSSTTASKSTININEDTKNSTMKYSTTMFINSGGNKAALNEDERIEKQDNIPLFEEKFAITTNNIQAKITGLPRVDDHISSNGDEKGTTTLKEDGETSTSLIEEDLTTETIIDKILTTVPDKNEDNHVENGRTTLRKDEETTTHLFKDDFITETNIDGILKILSDKNVDDDITSSEEGVGTTALKEDGETTTPLIYEDLTTETIMGGILKTVSGRTEGNFTKKNNVDDLMKTVLHDFMKASDLPNNTLFSTKKRVEEHINFGNTSIVLIYPEGYVIEDVEKIIHNMMDDSGVNKEESVLLKDALLITVATDGNATRNPQISRFEEGNVRDQGERGQATSIRNRRESPDDLETLPNTKPIIKAKKNFQNITELMKNVIKNINGAGQFAVTDLKKKTKKYVQVVVHKSLILKNGEEDDQIAQSRKKRQLSTGMFSGAIQRFRQLSPSFQGFSNIQSQRFELPIPIRHEGNIYYNHNRFSNSANHHPQKFYRRSGNQNDERFNRQKFHRPSGNQNERFNRPLNHRNRLPNNNMNSQAEDLKSSMRANFETSEFDSLPHFERTLEFNSEQKVTPASANPDGVIYIYKSLPHYKQETDFQTDDAGLKFRSTTPHQKQEINFRKDGSKVVGLELQSSTQEPIFVEGYQKKKELNNFIHHKGFGNAYDSFKSTNHKLNNDGHQFGENTEYIDWYPSADLEGKQVNNFRLNDSPSVDLSHTDTDSQLKGSLPFYPAGEMSSKFGGEAMAPYPSASQNTEINNLVAKLDSVGTYPAKEQIIESTSSKFDVDEITNPKSFQPTSAPNKYVTQAQFITENPVIDTIQHETFNFLPHYVRKYDFKQEFDFPKFTTATYPQNFWDDLVGRTKEVYPFPGDLNLREHQIKSHKLRNLQENQRNFGESKFTVPQYLNGLYENKQNFGEDKFAFPRYFGYPEHYVDANRMLNYQESLNVQNEVDSTKTSGLKYLFARPKNLDLNYEQSDDLKNHVSKEQVGQKHNINHNNKFFRANQINVHNGPIFIEHMKDVLNTYQQNQRNHKFVFETPENFIDKTQQNGFDFGEKFQESIRKQLEEYKKQALFEDGQNVGEAPAQGLNENFAKVEGNDWQNDVRKKFEEYKKQLLEGTINQQNKLDADFSAQSFNRNFGSTEPSSLGNINFDYSPQLFGNVEIAKNQQHESNHPQDSTRKNFEGLNNRAVEETQNFNFDRFKENVGDKKEQLDLKDWQDIIRRNFEDYKRQLLLQAEQNSGNRDRPKTFSDNTKPIFEFNTGDHLLDLKVPIFDNFETTTVEQNFYPKQTQENLIQEKQTENLNQESVHESNIIRAGQYISESPKESEDPCGPNHDRLEFAPINVKDLFEQQNFESSYKPNLSEKHQNKLNFVYGTYPSYENIQVPTQTSGNDFERPQIPEQPYPPIYTQNENNFHDGSLSTNSEGPYPSQFQLQTSTTNSEDFLEKPYPPKISLPTDEETIIITQTQDGSLSTNSEGPYRPHFQPQSSITNSEEFLDKPYPPKISLPTDEETIIITQPQEEVLEGTDLITEPEPGKVEAIHYLIKLGPEEANPKPERAEILEGTDVVSIPEAGRMEGVHYAINFGNVKNEDTETSLENEGKYESNNFPVGSIVTQEEIFSKDIDQTYPERMQEGIHATNTLTEESKYADNQVFSSPNILEDIKKIEDVYYIIKLEEDSKNGNVLEGVDVVTEPGTSRPEGVHYLIKLGSKTEGNYSKVTSEDSIVSVESNSESEDSDQEIIQGIDIVEKSELNRPESVHYVIKIESNLEENNDSTITKPYSEDQNTLEGTDFVSPFGDGQPEAVYYQINLGSIDEGDQDKSSIPYGSKTVTSAASGAISSIASSSGSSTTSGSVSSTASVTESNIDEEIVSNTVSLTVPSIYSAPIFEDDNSEIMEGTDLVLESGMKKPEGVHYKIDLGSSNEDSGRNFEKIEDPNILEGTDIIIQSEGGRRKEDVHYKIKFDGDAANDEIVALNILEGTDSILQPGIRRPEGVHYKINLGSLEEEMKTANQQQEKLSGVSLSSTIDKEDTSTPSVQKNAVHTLERNRGTTIEEEITTKTSTSKPQVLVANYIEAKPQGLHYIINLGPTGEENVPKLENKKILPSITEPKGSAFSLDKTQKLEKDATVTTNPISKDQVKILKLIPDVGDDNGSSKAKIQQILQVSFKDSGDGNEDSKGELKFQQFIPGIFANGGENNESPLILLSGEPVHIATVEDAYIKLNSASQSIDVTERKHLQTNLHPNLNGQNLNPSSTLDQNEDHLSTVAKNEDQEENTITKENPPFVVVNTDLLREYNIPSGALAYLLKQNMPITLLNRNSFTEDDELIWTVIDENGIVLNNFEQETNKIISNRGDVFDYSESEEDVPMLTQRILISPGHQRTYNKENLKSVILQFGLNKLKQEDFQTKPKAVSNSQHLNIIRYPNPIYVTSADEEKVNVGEEKIDVRFNQDEENKNLKPIASLISRNGLEKIHNYISSKIKQHHTPQIQNKIGKAEEAQYLGNETIILNNIIQHNESEEIDLTTQQLPNILPTETEESLLNKIFDELARNHSAENEEYIINGLDIIYHENTPPTPDDEVDVEIVNELDDILEGLEQNKTVEIIFIDVSEDNSTAEDQKVKVEEQIIPQNLTVSEKENLTKSEEQNSKEADVAGEITDNQAKMKISLNTLISPEIVEKLQQDLQKHVRQESTNQEGKIETTSINAFPTSKQVELENEARNRFQVEENAEGVKDSAQTKFGPDEEVRNQIQEISIQPEIIKQVREDIKQHIKEESSKIRNGEISTPVDAGEEIIERRSGLNKAEGFEPNPANQIANEGDFQKHLDSLQSAIRPKVVIKSSIRNSKNNAPEDTKTQHLLLKLPIIPLETKSEIDVQNHLGSLKTILQPHDLHEESQSVQNNKGVSHGNLESTNVLTEDLLEQSQNFQNHLDSIRTLIQPVEGSRNVHDEVKQEVLNIRLPIIPKSGEKLQSKSPIIPTNEEIEQIKKSITSHIWKETKPKLDNDDNKDLQQINHVQIETDSFGESELLRGVQKRRRIIPVRTNHNSEENSGGNQEASGGVVNGKVKRKRFRVKLPMIPVEEVIRSNKDNTQEKKNRIVPIEEVIRNDEDVQDIFQTHLDSLKSVIHPRVKRYFRSSIVESGQK